MYEIEFSEEATKELLKMMKSDIQAYKKFEDLIPELREHPYTGTGHPSSGDNIFYKVRDANHIVLIDSFGNEPQKEDKKN